MAENMQHRDHNHGDDVLDKGHGVRHRAGSNPLLELLDSETALLLFLITWLHDQTSFLSKLEKRTKRTERIDTHIDPSHRLG